MADVENNSSQPPSCKLMLGTLWSAPPRRRSAIATSEFACQGSLKCESPSLVEFRRKAFGSTPGTLYKMFQQKWSKDSRTVWPVSARSCTASSKGEGGDWAEPWSRRRQLIIYPLYESAATVKLPVVCIPAIFRLRGGLRLRGEFVFGGKSSSGGNRLRGGFVFASSGMWLGSSLLLGNVSS